MKFDYKQVYKYHIPALTTACVCADVPEAIFVNAHAASNCNDGLQAELKLYEDFFLTEELLGKKKKKKKKKKAYTHQDTRIKTFSFCQNILSNTF